MPIVNSFSGGSARGYGFTSGGAKPILISASPAPSATVTTYSGYIVFKFTASGTLNVGVGTPGTADAFVLGGGFSGGPGSNSPLPGTGGSGGAGGRRVASPAVSITSNTPIPVTVGGAASNSSFGPVSSAPGPTGGGGGGGGFGAQPSPPSYQQGFPGSPGGGGPANDYETGTPVAYGGGGGGGGGASFNFNVPNPGGGGGSTGGGAGGRGATYYGPPFTQYPGAPGGAGTANTGGGGGAGGGSSTSGISQGSGAAGGSGAVIIRFPNTQFTV